MQLEHRLSALLRLHLHSRLSTWLQWIGPKQLQDETRSIFKFWDLVRFILEIWRKNNVCNYGNGTCCSQYKMTQNIDWRICYRNCNRYCNYVCRWNDLTMGLQGSRQEHGLTLISAWMSKHMSSKMWYEFTFHFHSSTIAPLKFKNGYVVSTYTFSQIYLHIHPGIEVSPCQ